MTAKKTATHQRQRGLKKVFRLAYGVDELAIATGISRGVIYKALADGTLKAKKVGSRTVILRSAALAYLKNLPEWGDASAA